MPKFVTVELQVDIEVPENWTDKWIQDADWFDQAIDTETDYTVLDKSGKVL